MRGQAPGSFQHSSSLVSQPMPWMKAPSIWPISIAGLIELPASCRMSAPQQFPFTGQRIDDDFGDGGAVGEVVKRAALHRSRSQLRPGVL